MSPEPDTLLNRLLDGRSDAFKAKVLDIVYRHHIDPNDPNFQILIATGQLEVLLQDAPQDLEQKFAQLLETLRRLVDAELKSFRQVVTAEQEALRQSLLGMKQLTEEQQQAFEHRLQTVQAAISQERSHLIQDAVMQTQGLEERAIHQQAEHDRQRETAVQQYKAALAQDAQYLIQQAAEELRGTWGLRVALPSAIAAIIIASIGGFAGWSAKSAQVYQHYSPAELAYLDKLWVWNSDRLLQCQAEKATHCTLQIVPPQPPSR
jgi:uncharacterized protein YdiU (UPF0061 family)